MKEMSNFFDEIPQSVLISGANLARAGAFVENWSTRLLKTDREALKTHPDFYTVYPQNKMRQIGVTALREMKQNVYTTAQRGDRKVFVIYEADRLNASASNALLKTLEEPTDSSSIFLVTTKPYDVLPTLRSRCWWIQLHLAYKEEEYDAELSDWVYALEDFLIRLAIEKQKVPMVEAYSLLYRMQNYVTRKTAQLNVPANRALSEEEQAAQTAQAEKQITENVFRAVEWLLGNFAQDYPSFRRDYPNAIELLERCFSRTKVNLGVIPALESFFLSFVNLTK